MSTSLALLIALAPPVTLTAMLVRLARTGTPLAD
jgi:hypothetical protein